MDFSLTDDQRLIRDTVRQFMDAEVRPTIRARDREEKFASAELRKLGALGCCVFTSNFTGGALADPIWLTSVSRRSLGEASASSAFFAR